MKKYGLIGYPLTHSFSKSFFERKFKNENINDHIYKNIEIENINLIKEKITLENLSGFNVTSPFKEKIIPFLDKISLEAKKIHAVNTVLIKENKWIGFNTDWIGFHKTLNRKKHHKSAIIIGNGGASKAIIFALKKMNINYEIFARKNTKRKIIDINKDDLKKNQIIINCTPIGTFPEISKSPSIPYKFLNKDHLLYDLIYNPRETLFIKEGIIRNCQTQNGFEMLKIQALESWKIWNNINKPIID